MNTKILIIISITILAAGSAVYLLFTTQKQTPQPKIPPPAVVTPPGQPTALHKPSLQDLTKLWANGVRCPKSGFAIPSKPEDFVQPPTGGAEFAVNVVEVNFTDDATCEDAERVALLLNGRIVGFGPVTNLYGIQIPTRTVPELEAAIQKVEALNDPKIEGVFEAVIPGLKEKGL